MPDEIPEATSITDTAPCTGCGLCCDGTIYSKAPAEADEQERLTAAGLTVVEEQGQHHFIHPCRFSIEGRCGNYENRFTICRSYRCKLLASYQDGGITLQDARSIIERALALRSDVADEEPNAKRNKDRQLLRERLAGSKQRLPLQLKMAAFDYHLDNWFRVPLS